LNVNCCSVRATGTSHGLLHDGMCSDDPEWFAGLAGAAKQHGEANWSRGSLALHVADPEHPITAGTADFVFEDEAFHRLRRRPELDVLLEAPLPDGDRAGEVVPQAWSYEVKTAAGATRRAFVWMQGHYTERLLEPLHRDLILRGIAWAAGRPADALLSERPPRR
jgi:type 1 glutamine amidotransferase